MNIFNRQGRLPEDVEIQEIDERHDLSQQIFVRRERAGWTQEELASRSGLTQSQVAKLEAGYSNPTLRTLVRLASAFKCRVQELLDQESFQRMHDMPSWEKLIGLGELFTGPSYFPPFLPREQVSVRDHAQALIVFDTQGLVDFMRAPGVPSIRTVVEPAARPDREEPASEAVA